jgi:uncharacterized protein (UPF0332 family)
MFSGGCSAICCTTAMLERDHPLLHKARESLAGAQLEFTNGWYNNCANRCYYACFQAAIAALQRAGIRPRGDQWSHAFVSAQFEGQLIYRRKHYSTALRSVLERTHALRRKADYDGDAVTCTEAERSLHRARAFVSAIQSGGGEPR